MRSMLKLILPIKKRLIIDNILEAVKSVSKKEKINYSLFEEDVREFCDNNNIII